MATRHRPTPPVATLAKFSRPRLFNVQKRERLFKLIDERRAHPILWIAGPPGSGVTGLNLPSSFGSEETGCSLLPSDAGDTIVGTATKACGRTIGR